MEKLKQFFIDKIDSYTIIHDRMDDIKDPDGKFRAYYRGTIYGLNLALKELEIYEK